MADVTRALLDKQAPRVIARSGTYQAIWEKQAAGSVFAGPTSGDPDTPEFRPISEVFPGGDVNAGNLPPLFTASVQPGNEIVFSQIPQQANKIFAGPASGGAANPTFRFLEADDLPALAYVQSVSLTMPAIFTVTGSPGMGIVSLGVSLVAQQANKFFAGPSSGADADPSFRTVVTQDIFTAALPIALKTASLRG